ncbi:metalloregulator ArsR/SmtB family transcription factor [Desulfovibrio sp. OttesenSCG-928-F07]|nr:metalloregulator ArsR/SmtB family transcription factor [Desulfovibrio sp. OttesenSCG-928-F07]
MNTLHSMPHEWDKVVAVFSALGDLTRQKIIMLFEPGEELSIKDVAEQFDLGRTTVVHHLTVLYNSGILNMRRKGRQTLYSVVYDDAFDAMRRMRMFIEEHSLAATCEDYGLITFGEDLAS